VSGAELYAAMVDYLEENGWHREEPGSGWWLHSGYAYEETIGRAVEEQLREDGIDTRYEPAVSSREERRAG
jgi:hypothetical protein